MCVVGKVMEPLSITVTSPEPSLPLPSVMSESIDIDLPTSLPRPGELALENASTLLLAAPRGMIDADRPMRRYVSSVAQTSAHVGRCHETKLHVSLPRLVKPPVSEAAHTEWSVAEDRLLLTLDDRGVEVTSGYARANERLPSLYPKASCKSTDAALSDRIALLRTAGMKQWTRLLRRLTDDEAEALVRHMRCGDDSPSGVGFRLTSPHKANIHVDEQQSVMHSHATSNPSVALRGITEDNPDNPGDAVLCSAADVCAISQYIKALYQDSAPDNAARTQSSIITIDLDERENMYQLFKGQMRGVFAPDNLQRFAAFAEAPDLLQKLSEKTALLSKLKAEMERAKQSLLSTVQDARVKKLAALDEDEARSISAATALLDSMLDEDLRALRALHDTHKQLELGRLKKHFDAARQRSTAFFDAENAAVSWLASFSETTAATNGDALRSLTAETVALAGSIDRVLPKSGLCRLLLLAELVLSQELRLACIELIANNFTDLARDPALASPILGARTLEELLAAVPSDQLLTVCRNAGLQLDWNVILKQPPRGDAGWVDERSTGGIPLPYLWREVCRRSMEVFDACRRLSLEQLRLLRSAATSTPSPIAGELSRFASDVRVFKEVLLIAWSDAERAEGGGPVLPPQSAAAINGDEESTTAIASALSSFGPLCVAAHGVMVFGCAPRASVAETEPATVALGATMALRSDNYWLLAARGVTCRKARTELRILPQLTHLQYTAAAARRCGESTVRHYFDARIVSLSTKLPFAVAIAIGFEAPDNAPMHQPARNALADAWRRTQRPVAPSASKVSVMWSSDGVLLYGGRAQAFPPVETGAMYTVGDVVGIGLDETTGSICLTKNGRVLTPPTDMRPSQKGTASSPLAVDSSVDAVAPHVAEESSGRWLDGLLSGQGPMCPIVSVFSAGEPFSGGDNAVVAVNFSGPWYSARCHCRGVDGQWQTMAATGAGASAALLPPFESFVDAIGHI